MEETRDEIEISLLDILVDLWKYKWVVVLFLFGGLGLGFLFGGAVRQESYATTASLLVNAKNTSGYYHGNQLSPEANEVYLSQNLTSTVAELAASNRVLKEVAEEVNLDKEAMELVRRNLSVTAKKDTSFIVISLNWQDEQQAMDIVNSLMRVLPEVMRNVMDIGDVNVIDYAEEAAVVAVRTEKMALIGAAAGLILGVMLVVAIGLLKPRIRSSSDVERNFSIEIIGEIPFAKNGEKLLAAGATDDYYQEAYGAFVTIFKHLAVKREVRTVAITSSVQSEGKSTVAYNLAVCLAKQESRVLLLDCDFRKKTLTELLVPGDKAGGKAVEEMSEEMSEEIAEGVVEEVAEETLLKSLDDTKCLWTAAGLKMDWLTSGEKTKQPLIEKWEQQFDYIIMDTSPLSVVSDAMALKDIVDGVVFVVKHNESAIRDMTKAVKRLEKIDVPILGCVVNEVKRAPSGYRYYKKYGSN